MAYLLMRIGCIECCEASYPVIKAETMGEIRLAREQHEQMLSAFEQHGEYMTINLDTVPTTLESVQHKD